MSSKLVVVVLALAVFASSAVHAEGRRRERAPSPVIALNRQRMEALRPAVEQFLPLTADVQAAKAEWDRRLAARGTRNFEAIVMTQRELAMGTRAAEPSAIPRFMTLALRELHDYLAGSEVAEQDVLTSMWPSTVVAAAGYLYELDQSYVSRMAALLISTAKVFANPRIELESLVTLARSLELQGRMKEAYEARRSALELAAKIEDRAAILGAIEYGGKTREEAEREVGSQVTDRVAEYFALVADVIVASPEPELQPAIRTVLQRATRASFVGNGGTAVSLAAHAVGQFELARSLAKQKASAAPDGEALANDAIAKANEQLAKELGIAIPAPPKASSGAKDPGAQLRLQLLERVVGTGAQISAADWKKLAELSVQVDERATAERANASSGAERANVLARAKASRQQLGVDAKGVIAAFALSLPADALIEQYAPLQVPLDTDLAYLLDRIEDKDLRVALLALDIKQLERTRTTLDKSDRATFFASTRARRAYRSLLAAMIDRGKANDLERALAVGELTRARQLKDLTGRGVGSFEKLLSEPDAFAKRTQKSLGKEAALVSFHELEDGFVALIVAEGRVQKVRIGASVRAIDALAAELRTAIMQRRDATKPLRGAYDVLIEPWQASLAGKKTLLLVPDGELGTVPFEALTNAKGQRLIEQHEVRYLPAIALLSDAPSRSKPAGLFAMADPEYAKLGALQPRPLPDTKQEVQEIEGVVKGASSLWFGADASETKLKSSDLTKFAYVHFATHGILGGVAAGYLEPGLLLSKSAGDDGVLTMSEAQQLKLSAKLAVLSACDTGRGERIVGEGALSISRAFLLAGAEAVVVSLWTVDSAATKELMVALYAELAKGATPAAALQSVKLKMMKANASAPPPAPRALVLEDVKPQPASYGHPFYWSAFVLVGG